MQSESDILEDVMQMLRQMDPQQRVITPTTLILTDLDFDSLQMLDLLEIIKARYGVNLLLSEYSLDFLRTPEILAKTLSGLTSST